MNIIRPDGTKAMTLPDAVVRLENALANFEVAEGQYQSARRTRDAAVRDVDEAQQMIDRAMADLRALAPASSLWKRSPGELA